MERRETTYDKLNLFEYFINAGKDLDMKTPTQYSRKLYTFYDKVLLRIQFFMNECLNFFGFLKELGNVQRQYLNFAQCYMTLKHNKVLHRLKDLILTLTSH